MDGWESVKSFAILALVTKPVREVKTEVAPWDAVGPRVPRILRDNAPPLGFRLGQVLVFSVATAPFVVPDVENRAGLGRRLGFY